MAIALFVLTYWIMMVGRIKVGPWFRLTRPAASLSFGIILLASGAIPYAQLASAIHFTTLLILLALMLISAIFYCSGFYSFCAAKIAQIKISPPGLLSIVILTSAFLSAWCANDIVAFAMTPLLCKGLYRRGIDSRPYLFALMGGCNAGSLMTMLGTPQNVLIAQHVHIKFWDFFLHCAPLACVNLVIVWLITWWVWRKNLHNIARDESTILPFVEQKSFVIGLMLLVLFVLGLSIFQERYLPALVIIGLVVVLYWFHINEIIRRVDWRVLSLFLGLFLVNAAFANTGVLQTIVQWLQHHNFHMNHVAPLTIYTIFSVNTVGKVASTIFLLNLWPHLGMKAGYTFAILLSALSNTMIIASLSNIIVAERASVKIKLLDHLKAGLPMTLVMLVVSLLYIRAFIF